MNLNVATVISRIFEPMVVLTIVSVLGGFHAGLSGAQLWQYFMKLFGLMVLPVFIFRVWLVFSGRVKNWDIVARKERIVPLLLSVVFVIFTTVLIAGFQNMVLNQLFSILVLWVVGFFLITLVWKISGHASISALGTGMLLSWYGIAWWPVLLIVPLVGWSRVIRRDHTVTQVIVGAIYGWGIVYLYEIWQGVFR